jgi:hypothetical protein
MGKGIGVLAESPPAVRIAAVTPVGLEVVNDRSRPAIQAVEGDDNGNSQDWENACSVHDSIGVVGYIIEAHEKPNPLTKSGGCSGRPPTGAPKQKPMQFHPVILKQQLTVKTHNEMSSRKGWTTCG